MRDAPASLFIGRIIAYSGEGYSSESECKKDIERLKDSKDAPVKKE